jgi:two-component system copper resistance phosphate regulon response regulator CusR
MHPPFILAESNMRMLVIEDSDGIRAALAHYFEELYFAVDQASTGEEGSYLARTTDYDIIILDNLLPDKDGIVVCNEIREQGSCVPILVLSGITAPAEKIKLLDAGADDYITKPFLLKEIHSRVKALLRRPKHIVPDVLCAGQLVFDSTCHRVRYKDTEIHLTKKEFSLLEYFMRNINIVVSRGEIMEHVWNMDTDPFSNTIEAHMFNLRKKILIAECVAVETIPGRGYRLRVIE